MTLTLLPAVDIVDGQVEGAAGQVDPVGAALAWQDAGAEWVHLVDLDEAFGRGSNAETLAEVVGRLDVPVEVSGGVRDDQSLRRARRNDTEAGMWGGGFRLAGGCRLVVGLGD